MIVINNYSAFSSMMEQVNMNANNLPIQCNLVKVMPMNNNLILSGLANPEPELEAPIWIYNSSMANTLVLSNLDANSEPENQFKMSDNTNFNLLPGRWVMAICWSKI